MYILINEIRLPIKNLADNDYARLKFNAIHDSFQTPNEGMKYITMLVKKL